MKVDIGGKYYNLPSVTKIIDQLDKSGLKYWAVEQAMIYLDAVMDQYTEEHNRKSVPISLLKRMMHYASTCFEGVSKDEARWGIRVNELIDEFLSTYHFGKVGGEEEQVVHAYKAFVSWYHDNRAFIEPVGADGKHVVQEIVIGNGYCGYLDWRMLYKGNEYVIDIKTSKTKTKAGNDTMVHDSARYQVGAYAKAKNLKHGGILRCPKTGDPAKFTDVSRNLDQYIECFICLRNLWYNAHPRKAKEAGGLDAWLEFT